MGNGNDQNRKNSPTPPVQFLRTRYKPVFDDLFADLLAKLDKINYK